jgi:hypothetical protein
MEYITNGGCDSGESTGRGVEGRRHHRTREPRNPHHAAAGLQGPPRYGYHALSQSKAREKQPEKFYFSLNNSQEQHRQQQCPQHAHTATLTALSLLRAPTIHPHYKTRYRAAARPQRTRGILFQMNTAAAAAQGRANALSFYRHTNTPRGTYNAAVATHGPYSAL